MDTDRDFNEGYYRAKAEAEAGYPSMAQAFPRPSTRQEREEARRKEEEMEAIGVRLCDAFRTSRWWGQDEYREKAMLVLTTCAEAYKAPDHPTRMVKYEEAITYLGA